MSNITASFNQLKFFDELARKRTIIHQLHPLTKLLTTLGFLVTVTSFGKYEVISLLPLILYPIVIISLGDLPLIGLLKRMLIAVPFALGVGIFNPIFDRTILFFIGEFPISGGWLSFASIMLRFGMTVLTALVLIATSGIEGIGEALVKLKLPRVFVTQLLLMYRYISLLMEEIARAIRAHSLRFLKGKGLHHHIWGSLVGQLLLRTIDRAGRIYQAMCCRGFTGEIRMIHSRRFQLRDLVYLVVWYVFFLLVRFYNIPVFLGDIFMGVHS